MQDNTGIAMAANSSSESGNEVLTTEEAAAKLGISTRTMRRLVAQRRIRFWKIGRLVRLQAGDVDSFLSMCTVEPVS